jgi:pimeloyl-ACP methyl ester carboxylesterase
VAQARQLILHGLADDVVPLEFSRNYAAKKKKAHEKVELVEVANADHFDLIDPRSKVWPQVEEKVLNLLST